MSISRGAVIDARDAGVRLIASPREDKNYLASTRNEGGSEPPLGGDEERTRRDSNTCQKLRKLPGYPSYPTGPRWPRRPALRLALLASTRRMPRDTGPLFERCGRAALFRPISQFRATSWRNPCFRGPLGGPRAVSAETLAKNTLYTAPVRPSARGGSPGAPSLEVPSVPSRRVGELPAMTHCATADGVTNPGAISHKCSENQRRASVASASMQSDADPESMGSTSTSGIAAQPPMTYPRYTNSITAAVG